MARSFYFQLQPEGMGTADAECLTSYLYRLAATHGATLYQLLNHLDAWWKPQANRRFVHLPKHGYQVRYAGYGRNTSLIVQVLEAGTALSSLRGCTLLTLRNVCAGNGVGAIKQSRAWCPSCYAEAVATGSPIYDRLLWQIQGVIGCSIHGTRLVQHCGNCGEVQRHLRSKTTLDRCEVCEESLLIIGGCPCGPQDETYNMAHVRSFIEFTSSNPGFEFELGGLTTFIDAMVERHTRAVLMNHLGDVFHKRWYHLKPMFSTMLAISSYFDIPVQSILSSPRDAASQTDFGFTPVIRERVERLYRDPVRRERAWCALKAALAAGEPYPSLSSVACTADVTISFLHHKFPKGVARLVELRRESGAVTRRYKTAKVMVLLKKSMNSREFSTERERVHWVAGKAGTSIAHVRQVRTAMVGEDHARRRNWSTGKK